MSYTPTVWKSGDVVTSAKLNKLENGVAAAGGGSVLVINATPDFDHAESEEEVPLTLDKTAAEILAADKTELHISIGQGSYYSLTLVTKYSAGEGALTLMYSISMGETVIASTIGIDGEMVQAVMNIIDLSVLPSVNNYDDGKILKVVNEAWAPVDNDFIITCTPTAADMSGTMDKTPAEIKAAYEAGAEIRVRVVTAENRFSEIIPESLNVTTADGEVSYVIVAATFVYQPSAGVNYLVQAVTSGVDSTYSTSIFALTHPSP